MPPLHPAIVHYPIALTVTSVLADTVGLNAAVPSLLLVGQWGMAIAAAGAVVAATAGYSDMKRDELQHETHEMVHLHMKSGLAIATALVAAAIWRWSLPDPSLPYLIVGWLLLGGIALQAWLGGEIVYAHGGGVAAAGQGTSPEQQAKQPSRRFFCFVTGKSSTSKSENTTPPDRAS